MAAASMRSVDMSFCSGASTPAGAENRRNRVRRRDALAQADAVAHRTPFRQSHLFLLTQIPQDFAYRSAELPADRSRTAFRNENHAMLAFPTHMRLGRDVPSTTA